MNVRIFWVRAMKCMYAQTRPRFILSSEGFGGMEFEPMLTPREKSPLPKMSPEEDRTRDAVDSEPKHYQLSYSDPQVTGMTWTRKIPITSGFWTLDLLLSRRVPKPLGQRGCSRVKLRTPSVVGASVGHCRLAWSAWCQYAEWVR